MSSGTNGVSMNPERTTTWSIPSPRGTTTKRSGSSTTGTDSVTIVMMRTVLGSEWSSWRWLLRLCGTSIGLDAR